MSIITVKSQKELDMIPLDTNDIIRIEFGTPLNPAVLRNRYKYLVVARENSSVEARENSSVEARGNSSVVAWENSSVEARGNSSVVAWENSSVEAWGNSYVVARENSSVEARENSSVEAWGNSSVEAWGNTQVVDCLQGATIQLSGNARTVFMPRNIEEYMNFYEINHTKTTAFFFKAVHRRCGGFYSDRDSFFQYKIGEKAIADKFDTNPSEACGHGIHFSHLAWALDYGRDWSDLAIIEVKAEIKDVLLPKCSDGKVRAPQVEVVREVPLDECGVFGKILSKRHNR